MKFGIERLIETPVLRRPLIGKAHHAASRGHRHDARDTELDGLLHRQVHFLPRLQRLHQGDRQW